MFELYRTILQVLATRAGYDKIRDGLQLRLIDSDMRKAVRALDTYYTSYPGHDKALPDLLMATITIQNPDLGDEKLRIYKGMLDIMTMDSDPGAAAGIIRSLREVDFGAKLERIYESYNEGSDIDLFEEIKDLCKRFEKDLDRGSECDYNKDSIFEILEEESSGHRFTWALDCLNHTMPNVRTGDQYIFGARPGKGKTSFCAFNLVHMVKNTPDARPVAWFNNEGKSRKIKGSTYRAALQMDFDGIGKLGAKSAYERYNELVGGDDRIRIFDVHGRDYKYIERIIDEHRPAVVIFDMLDNVKGFGDAARTDLRLEFLYQWARECAVIYDFLSIPTKQVSVEGEDTAWIPMSALKDSKTGVQGACDAVITMGVKNAKGFERSRYLYVPKEAKQSPAKGAHPNCMTEVIFDAPRCQFIEAVQAQQGDLPA